MTRAGIKLYHFILTGAYKILTDDADETKEKKVSALKLLNKITKNELVTAQEGTVCFQVVEEAKTKPNQYQDTILAWTKLARKFEPSTGDSKTILRKCF